MCILILRVILQRAPPWVSSSTIALPQFVDPVAQSQLPRWRRAIKPGLVLPSDEGVRVVLLEPGRTFNAKAMFLNAMPYLAYTQQHLPSDSSPFTGHGGDGLVFSVAQNNMHEVGSNGMGDGHYLCSGLGDQDRRTILFLMTPGDLRRCRYRLLWSAGTRRPFHGGF